MSRTTAEFKVVVVGPFGVGKTTLITNISTEDVVGTEVPTTGDEAGEKDSTTVGLEYGVLDVAAGEFDIKLRLYGTPGQRRFRFMWDVVSIGADGFVILVDASRPETWDEVSEMVGFFARRNPDACVIGANRVTHGSPAHLELIRSLGVDGVVPVVACDVTDERSSRDLMVALLGRLIGDEEPDDPSQPDSPHPARNEHGNLPDPEPVERSQAQADRSQRALAGRN